MLLHVTVFTGVRQVGGKHTTEAAGVSSERQHQHQHLHCMQNTLPKDTVAGDASLTLATVACDSLLGTVEPLLTYKSMSTLLSSAAALMLTWVPLLTPCRRRLYGGNTQGVCKEV